MATLFHRPIESKCVHQLLTLSRGCPPRQQLQRPRDDLARRSDFIAQLLKLATGALDQLSGLEHLLAAFGSHQALLRCERRNLLTARIEPGSMPSRAAARSPE